MWVLLALLPLAALLAVMFRFAGAQPIQRNLTVELEGLPVGTRPLRIVLLSDFHVARYGDTPERLRETVARVNALRPDIVLLAGDFLADHFLGGYPMRPAVEPLTKLRAPLGLFAVFGNHDYANPDRLGLWLKLAGVRVINNEAERAGPLTIVGIGDDFTKHADALRALAAAKRQSGIPIVLTHSPDAIPELPRKIQLALSGHTHCGQIVLPLVGPLDTRSRYGRRYACGVVREGQRTIVVTAGLGVSRLPLRFGVPPDFWVITVVPRKTPGPTPRPRPQVRSQALPVQSLAIPARSPRPH